MARLIFGTKSEINFPLVAVRIIKRSIPVYRKLPICPAARLIGLRKKLTAAAFVPIGIIICRTASKDHVIICCVFKVTVL